MSGQNVAERVIGAPTAVTPGWYPDPADAAAVRWWDGREWTEHTTAHPTAEGGERPDAETPVPDATPLADSPPAPEAPELVEWWRPVEPEQEPVGHGAVPLPRLRPVPVSWSTSTTWSLALLPLLGVVFGVVALVVSSATGSETRLASGLALLVASVVGSRLDRAALRERGLTRLPSQWWLLLGPAFYLGSRYRKVTAAGGLAAAPFWLSVGTTVFTWALVAIGVALGALGGLLGAVVQPTSAEVSAMLQTRAIEAGFDWVVTCPGSVEIVAGTSFSCAVVDTEALVSSVTVTVTERDGALVYAVSGTE